MEHTTRSTAHVCVKGEIVKDDEELRDYLFKEIDVVQSIINRMGHNSFLIKGWTITLVVIVLVFRNTLEYTYLAAIPFVAFWFLDAYYLRQERLYRELYKWLVANRLKTNEHLLSMDTSRFDVSFRRVFFSITLLLFYVFVVSLMLASAVIDMFTHDSASVLCLLGPYLSC